MKTILRIVKEREVYPVDPARSRPLLQHYLCREFIKMADIAICAPGIMIKKLGKILTVEVTDAGEVEATIDETLCSPSPKELIKNGFRVRSAWIY